MGISVSTHAHRKLRRLGRYVTSSEVAAKAKFVMQHIAIEPDTILGCYQNDGNLATDWIVFTTDGVSAMFDGVWRHIPYSDIKTVVRGVTKDVDNDEVWLELRSMSTVKMLVTGKTERGTHDKYEVMMFLESVINANGQDD